VIRALRAYTAEPRSAVLSVDSEEVGRMVFWPEPGSNMSGVMHNVKLGQVYTINCVIAGGNPPVNVTLTSGNMTHPVEVTHTTERDTHDMMSEPRHVMDATLRWTPTVSDIARPFICSAGVKNPRAIWTSFTPMVEESKQ